MNLPFDDIITRANARKEALKEIQLKLEDLPSHVEALRTALRFFAEFRPLYNHLDAEGKSLLADLDRLDLRIERMASVGEQLTRNYFVGSDGLNLDSFPRLLEAAK